MSIKIEVVRVIRGCKAYSTGNKFTYQNSKIIPENCDTNGCANAQATIITNIGRLLFHNPLYVSCLDAGLTSEGCGNVIFKIIKVENEYETN
ncbi:MAG: hypothetical protein ACFFDW_06130 [Candidatus Thorarchaeota archaeon]